MEEAGGSGIEMEEIDPGTPIRQLSLESQSQRRPSPWILRWFMGCISKSWIPWWLLPVWWTIRWVLPGESNVVPQPSRSVYDAIKAGAKAYRSDARSFIRDFDRMSHRPRSRVQEIFDIFIRFEHIEIESEGTTGMLYHPGCLLLATDYC